MLSGSHEFEISLLENGIDFILKGIDELFTEDFIFRGVVSAERLSSANCKYGVLNLFSGMLLLMKERLYRHMPELIFVGDLDTVKRKYSEGKDLNTVDFNELVVRLETGPRVTFTSEQYKTICAMRRLRNVFEHYKGTFNKHHVWNTTASFLSVVDSFLINELQVRIEDATDEQRLVEKIHHIEAVWGRLKREDRDSWLADILEKKKEFDANRQSIIDDLAAENHADKGAFVQFTMCPECGEDSLIVVGEYTGICSNSDCDNVDRFTSCARCSGTAIGSSFDDFPLCDDCRNWIEAGESAD